MATTWFWRMRISKRQVLRRARCFRSSSLLRRARLRVSFLILPIFWSLRKMVRMLLFLNGHSTKELELMQRKELLKEALTETPNLKFNYHVENEGKAFYKSIEKSDLEGMMEKK